MNKVTVRAPVRADLAGGTLDLWPLYLFHPGARTVNVAISHSAESEVAEPGDRLAEHMLLHYTGVAHFSGTNNWEMYKRQIDGKRKVHKGFERIAQSAAEMEKALTNADFRAAGEALAQEWKHRKALIAGIST